MVVAKENMPMAELPSAKKRKVAAAASPTSKASSKGKQKMMAEDEEAEMDDMDLEALGSFEHVLERLGKHGGGACFR